MQHTHTHARRGRGSGIRAEKLSEVGFREEDGGVLGEAVRSCRRGQIAVELQPTFIWSRHEFCCLSGVGFWFTPWQQPTENTQQLFLKSKKERTVLLFTVGNPLNGRYRQQINAWDKSSSRCKYIHTVNDLKGSGGSKNLWTSSSCEISRDSTAFFFPAASVIEFSFSLDKHICYPPH